MLKSMATPQRKELADKAEAALEKMASRTFGAIEPPAAPTGNLGNWNSENRLVMRTHPIPPMQTQVSTAPPNTPPYANPAAPGDQGN